MLASPLTWYWPSGGQRLAPFCPTAARRNNYWQEVRNEAGSRESHRPPGGDHMTPRAAFWCALEHLGADAGDGRHRADLQPHLPAASEPQRRAGSVANGAAGVVSSAVSPPSARCSDRKRPANPIGWLCAPPARRTRSVHWGCCSCISPRPGPGATGWAGWLSRRWVCGVRPAALPDWFAAVAPLAAGGVGGCRRHGGWALGNTFAPAVPLQSAPPAPSAWAGRPVTSLTSWPESALPADRGGRHGRRSFRWYSDTGGPGRSSASS